MKKISEFAAPIGRMLFTLQFFMAMGTLFGNKAVAGAAAQGFPMPELMAKLAAILALTGALSILLGYKARVGACFIIAFLLPVTFTMHAYWKVEDTSAHSAQLIAFYKNINAIGGALLFVYFGSGPLSLEAYLQKRK